MIKSIYGRLSKWESKKMQFGLFSYIAKKAQHWFVKAHDM